VGAEFSFSEIASSNHQPIRFIPKNPNIGIHLYMYMYLYICVWVYIYIYIFRYIYIYIYMHISMYVCIYLYIHIFVYIGSRMSSHRQNEDAISPTSTERSFNQYDREVTSPTLSMGMDYNDSNEHFMSNKQALHARLGGRGVFGLGSSTSKGGEKNGSSHIFGTGGFDFLGDDVISKKGGSGLPPGVPSPSILR
jgi:hypothetical protein